MAMQSTNRERLFYKLDRLTESEIDDVFDFISRMEALRPEVNVEDRFSDDLVNSLAAARENERARTVMEWESIRQRASRSPRR